MERYFVVDGVVAAQTPKIVDAFSGILNEFQTIIEIGFHKGALTLWLHKNKKEKTKLIAYDISFAPKEVHDDSIDFRQGDCFSEEIINQIKDLISNGGKTLLLCDGGSKEVEFNLYSQFIKSGDVIMCHDYAHTPEEFSSITSQINWNCKFESRYDNIKGAVVTNNLEPYHYDTFKNVLWGSFIKK
jgi:23S rRNA U2552 (ribose-2'-O)-methylase RlmE/FtsJ